ncbi:MAG: hypothetical protein ACYTHK_17455 [Planctomycetota bacterium]|jgi:hypothetical protein
MAAKEKTATFREQVESLAPKLNQRLFNRARRASRLAKRLTGSQRKRAYGIKNRALKELIMRGAVTTELDWYCQPGLVSVVLDHDQRLHTRSAWMRDASDR